MSIGLCTRCSVIAISVFLIALAGPARADDELRTWTDNTGKHKIKAKFVSQDGDTVTLEKADGKEVEMSFKKLSKADQKFLQELAEDGDSPFKEKKDDSPFTEKKKTPAGGKTAGKDLANADDIEFVTAPLSESDAVPLMTDAEEWKVELAEPGDGLLFETKLKSAPLPPKPEFFEGLKHLVVNPQARKAALGYFLHDPKPAGRSRFVTVDLATGKSVKGPTVAGHYEPLALCEDGELLLVHKYPEDFHGKHYAELWRLNGPKIVERRIWRPFDNEAHNGNIYWGAFIGKDRIVLSSQAGQVGFWSTDKLESLFHLDLIDGSTPALSPDQKLLAFCDGERIGVLDIEKREVIAAAAAPQRLQWPTLAFSPTGKQIGCVAFNRLLTWETETGKLLGEVEAVNAHVNALIEFPSDDHLLAGQKYLFNMSDKLQLWQFDGHDKVRCAGGYAFFAVNEGNAKKQGLLVATPLPHAAVKQIRERALKDPSLFVLKEGTVVKLDLNAIPDQAQRAKVTDGIKKQLEEIKCTVGDNGTITLAATVEGPKPREVSFIARGTYNTQEWITTLKFVYNGAVVWQSTGTNVPGIISLKRGENIDGVLKANEKANYDWFGFVKLPRFLQKPAPGAGPGGQQSGFGLGQTRLTTAGLK